MTNKFEDLTGRIFSRWTVIKRAKSRGKNTYWWCQCSCKNQTIKQVARSSLVKGLERKGSVSCGCYRKEALIKARTTHGLSYTQLYNNMLNKFRHNKMALTKLTEQEQKRMILIYQIRDWFNSFGSKWHVDHIIPISKDGLHHPDNLQIIPAEYNLNKAAKLDYRMPEELAFRLEAARTLP